MKERLQKLKALLEELKSDSFGAQYGIADFAETNIEVDKTLKLLSRESAFYQKLLRELEDDQPPSWPSDLELKWKLEDAEKHPVEFLEWKRTNGYRWYISGKRNGAGWAKPCNPLYRSTSQELYEIFKAA